MTERPEHFLPLRPVEFQALVSLRGGDLHGYAILQDVESRGEGGAVPGLVTLYRALKRMEERGLVQEVEGDPPGDERRRTYRLTYLGARVLRAEALRLSVLVRAALGGGGPDGGSPR